MNKLLSILMAAIGLMVFVGAADADNEKIGLSLEAQPNPGPLYKELYRPLDASLRVTVSSGGSSPTITPLKIANVTFPRDMEFSPDGTRTPPCPDSKLSDQSNLAGGMAEIVALCPKSVIGTGTAVVQIAKLKSGTVTDPQLVIFNAGRNRAGRPEIKIYGYSKFVNSGLLMHGALAKSGELKIDIGVLPFDSSVSQFTLGIPGDPIEVEDASSESGSMTIQGQDPAYLRGKCSTGTWRATGAFVLGERASPSGTPIGDEFRLGSNPFSLPCHGRTGKAKLQIRRITGPKKISPGGKGRFVMVIKNSGTASARNLGLIVTGLAEGRSRPASIAPGKVRKFVLYAKTGTVKRRGKVKFRVTSGKKILARGVRKLLVG